VKTFIHKDWTLDSKQLVSQRPQRFGVNIIIVHCINWCIIVLYSEPVM